MNTIVLQYPEQLWVLPIALAVILLLRVLAATPNIGGCQRAPRCTSA